MTDDRLTIRISNTGRFPVRANPSSATCRTPDSPFVLRLSSRTTRNCSRAWVLARPKSQGRLYATLHRPRLPVAHLGVVSIRLLHDEVGLSYRHITVSTVGIVPGIRELAQIKLPIHLALSLHSPFDEIRDRLMPVNKRWPVAEVIRTMRSYQKATGRKITIEYLLISEITDTLDQAAELARLIKGVPSVVNLIPFNFVDTEQGFSRPSRERVRAFKGALKNRGVNVTERVVRGHDIAAACGQLAGEHQGRFARREGLSGLPAAAS